MNKTEWYPANITPVRDGVYETKHYKYGTKMRRWHDGWWMALEGGIICNRSVQLCNKWRGLTKEWE